VAGAVLKRQHHPLTRLRRTVAGCPDTGIGSKLIIQFGEFIIALPCDPEEIHILGREIYIYYPEGMARPKIPVARLERILQCTSTGRNWNTVNKLLAMAEALEEPH